jgi:RNA polymerase sigma factor (sigma-70 family)
VNLVDAEDRTLAAAVTQSRDESAFRVLYRRHTPPLYRLALRLGGGDESWAEELVQRAWIRAIEGLGGFAWRSAFRTWLSGIAINCAREQWRAMRTSPEVQGSPDLPTSSGDPGLRVDLERAIARLPHGYVCRTATARSSCCTMWRDTPTGRSRSCWASSPGPPRVSSSRRAASFADF